MFTYLKKYIRYILTFRYIRLISYWSAKYLHNKMKEYHKKEHDTDKYIKYNRYTYYYGFQIIYGGINKFLLLIILGILLNILPQFLITTISFVLLRIFSGGLHFNSYPKCSYISLLSFTIIALLAKYICLNQLASLLIFIFVFIIILKYAPVEHPNRPLTSVEKRKFKIIALYLLSTLYFAHMFTYYAMVNITISNSIIYGILLAGLIATPIINKLK